MHPSVFRFWGGNRLASRPQPRYTQPCTAGPDMLHIRMLPNAIGGPVVQLVRTNRS